MGTALLIAGAAVAAVGLYFLVVTFNDARTAARRAAEGRDAIERPERGVTIDIGEILKQINTLLDRVEKRYQLGLILVLLGAALMIVAYVVK